VAEQIAGAINYFARHYLLACKRIGVVVYKFNRAKEGVAVIKRPAAPDANSAGR
jgi:hypothetical protein